MLSGHQGQTTQGPEAPQKAWTLSLAVGGGEGCTFESVCWLPQLSHGQCDVNTKMLSPPGLCWAVQHHICSAQTGKCPCEKLCIFNEQSTKNILVSNILLIIVNFECSYFVVREQFVIILFHVAVILSF